MPTASPDSDPRIQTALRWCESHRLPAVTLAIPFPVTADMQSAALAAPGVVSIVVPPDAASAGDADRIGHFVPAAYSWELPARLAPVVVFVGGAERVAARMILAALRRGVRTLVCWDVDRWRARPLPLLVAGKVREKLLLGLQRGLSPLGPATTRAAALWEWFTRARLSRQLRAAWRESAPGYVPCPRQVLIACPTLVAGGAERQIVYTATGLAQQPGVVVRVVVSNLTSVPGNDFFRAPLVSAGVACEEVEGPFASPRAWQQYEALRQQGVPGRLRGLLKLLPAETAAEVLALYLAIREQRPAVVHAWLDHSAVCAGLAAVMAGVPRVVLSGRNVSPLRFAYILKPLMRPAYQAMAGCPPVILSNNSQGGAADYAAWLGLSLDRFEILYNGADLSLLRRADAAAIAAFRGECGIPPEAFLVGGMFRLSAEKRPRLWLDALARFAATRAEVHGLIFGAGPLRDELAAQLAAAGLAGRVRILPPTPGAALAMSAFDLLLLTSRWEGTPNVVLEAQAVGTPVVVCGEGGAGEALDPGVTGLFVDQPSVERIDAALQRIADDPDLRARLAAAGPAFVARRFGMARMLRETMALYGWAPPPPVPDSTD